MTAQNSKHPVTVVGVLEVDLAVYHGAVEVCVDGASPVYVSTDPGNQNPGAAADDSEWIGANSSNILVNRGLPPNQAEGNAGTGTKLWIYCASAGVQLHVHGR